MVGEMPREAGQDHNKFAKGERPTWALSPALSKSGWFAWFCQFLSPAFAPAPSGKHNASFDVSRNFVRREAAVDVGIFRYFTTYDDDFASFRTSKIRRGQDLIQHESEADKWFVGVNRSRSAARLIIGRVSHGGICQNMCVETLGTCEKKLARQALHLDGRPMGEEPKRLSGWPEKESQPIAMKTEKRGTRFISPHPLPRAQTRQR